MWKKIREQLHGERGIRLLVIVGVAGLGLILLSGFLPSGSEKMEEVSIPSSADTAEELQQYCNALEQRLENILEQVEGVGNCQVMLTATGTAETRYAQDEEIDQAESKLQTQQKCVIISDSNGEQALVQQIISPQISGVIVVCSGASSSVVKERVNDAVQAVLDIPSNRICVVPATENANS